MTYQKHPHCLVSATVTLVAPIDTMMVDLSHGLAANGVFSKIFMHAEKISDPAMFKALLAALREHQGSNFIVNLNAKDALIVERLDGTKTNVHDEWDIPLVAFMVDHPAYHEDILRAAPENTLVTFVDESHMDYFDAGDFPSRSSIFCPHGGPDPLPHLLGSAEREIDVLFIGTVPAPEETGAMLDRVSLGHPDHRKAIAAAHDRAQGEGEDIFKALKAAYQATDLVSRPEDLAFLVAELDRHVSNQRRFRILEATRRHRITLCGPVAPEAAARLAHHDLRGETRWGDALELMANAKVVLNSRVTFSRGAHERLFYALSRGAVVATEPSAFLADELENRLGMVLLPDHAGDMDQTLEGLLADDAALDDIRRRGLEAYVQRHSWKERAARILEGLCRHQEAGRGMA